MPSALVIGAGPAGALAAYLLRLHGWDVSLVEQHRFPRDKVCGECLSALGISVLDRYGLAVAFDDSAVVLDRAALHPPAGRPLELGLAWPMWGISRRWLDSTLLDAAVRKGARLLQPARAEQLFPGPRPAAVVRDLVTNAVQRIEADRILLADGKAGLWPARPAPTGDLGIKAHFTHVAGPRNAIELFGLRGHYVGLAAVETGHWNLAFNMPETRVRQFNGDLDALLAAVLDDNPTFRERLTSATRVGPWLASPLPRFAVLRRWPENVIPLGNAAAALEPIGGEGMGLALCSAELAVTALTEGFSPRALRADYQRLWRTRRLACRAVALAFSRPRLARTVTALARFLPPLTGRLMAWTGKADQFAA